MEHSHARCYHHKYNVRTVSRFKCYWVGRLLSSEYRLVYALGKQKRCDMVSCECLICHVPLQMSSTSTHLRTKKHQLNFMRAFENAPGVMVMPAVLRELCVQFVFGSDLEDRQRLHHDRAVSQLKTTIEELRTSGKPVHQERVVCVRDWLSWLQQQSTVDCKHLTRPLRDYGVPCLTHSHSSRTIRWMHYILSS